MQNPCGIFKENGKYVKAFWWYSETWTDDNFKSLLIKCATYISKKEISSPSDAIDVLNKSGIINSPDVWYAGTWTDDNFKSLLIKIANYVR